MARTTQEEKARKTAQIKALLEAKNIGVQAIAAKVGCSTRLVMSIKNGNGNTEQNGNGNDVTITGLNTEGKIEQVTITPTIEPQTIPPMPILSKGEDGTYHPTSVDEKPSGILVEAPPTNIFEGKAPYFPPFEENVAGITVKAWMALGAAKVELERVAKLKMYRNRPQLAGLKAAIELINEATV